jgi:hypothetical protein
VRARGPLDVGLLEQALHAVVQRHEAIRTVFRAAADGTPRQVVLDDFRLDVDVVDLRGVPAARREREMRSIARAAARRPFDLERDLMLRVTALRMSDEDHALLFLEHHIAFDGWSDEQLFAEVAELYAAALEEREPQLPELPVQYADFAVWQRRHLQGERLEQLRSYWREQLRGAPALLELPTDRPRPAVQRFDGVHEHFELPTELGERVRATAADEGASPFMVLLAAYAALLHRWTGADDIVIGSPIANRAHDELAHLIGFFSNTMVLRTRVDGGLTFRELVRRTRDVALGAYEHQDLPFEKLVEELRPPRDPRHNPLFQVNFRVQTGTSRALDLPDVESEPFDLDLGFSRFDLALELQLAPERFGGYLEYNSALFEPATARDLVGRFQTLVTAALDQPDTAIGELAFERPPQEPGSIRGRRALR